MIDFNFIIIAIIITNMAQASSLAARLAALHVPGNPLVLPNIWDVSSLETILSINTPTSTSGPAQEPGPLKAIATASYAIATSLGIQDEELSLDQNLSRVRQLAPIIAQANLPLTVDLQDGYGSRIEQVVASAVEAGAHGANIEDVVLATDHEGHEEGQFYGVEEQGGRIRAAISAAEKAGCPGFVVNARCDAFSMQSKTGLNDEQVMRDALTRGKAYLAAGATTVFYWGGSGRGLRTKEVQDLVDGLGGRVAVKLGAKGGLSVQELAEIGVARISVGPSLSFLKKEDVKSVAKRILGGGKLVE